MKVYPLFIAMAGCPHRCLFCDQEKSVNERSALEIAEIRRWLDGALPERGDGEIAFYGGTFTLLPVADQDACLAAANDFVRAGRVSGVRISTRPDALDDSSLGRLRDAGVTTIEVGCQSFDDEVLKSARRGHSAAQSVSAVKRCLDASFKVGVQLMPGLPGGDRAEALASLQQALLLRPSFLRIYPTVVIDETPLAELWRAGDYRPFSLEEAVELCADMLQRCLAVEMTVIRLGLQNDPSLEKNLLAGPYHPAFGQLVRSRLWRRALSRLRRGLDEVKVHPDDMSEIIGHRRENSLWLDRAVPGLKLSTDRAVERGHIRYSGQDRSFVELSAPGEFHG